MSLTLPIPQTFHLPLQPRGHLSEWVLRHLAGEPGEHAHTELAFRAVAETPDPIRDADIQLALFALYASAYGSIEGINPELEWDPELISTRRTLEGAFEAALRATVPVPTTPEPTVDAVARALFAEADADRGPGLARYLARTATREQALEFLVLRSTYSLREADPHSWAIPRLQGLVKAAIVEIQADEYGAGKPDRVHSMLYAAAMRGAGLDDDYAVNVDLVPTLTLASHNIMSMFGLNRRLLGAVVGHLAAFESTSCIPSRMSAQGLRRLGFGPDVTEYFDEHVEADAVHEELAARDLCGALAEARPELVPDILFGAAAYLEVEAWGAAEVLDHWQRSESALHMPLTESLPAAKTAPVPAPVTESARPLTTIGREVAS